MDKMDTFSCWLWGSISVLIYAYSFFRFSCSGCAISQAGVPGQKKRGRGRPRKSESKARAVGEVKKEEPPEEEDDDIIDAGALDDQG